MLVREILEDCQKGFAEVALMLGSSVASAEVYTMFEDLQFHNNIVTFLAEGGTHIHMSMAEIREARFIYRINDMGLPSYLVWFMDKDGQPALRVYLRKSEKEETNQPRHDLFMSLKDKYGETVRLGA